MVNDEFKKYLQQIEIETRNIPKKYMLPISPQIHRKLVHIFTNYINVNVISPQDVDEIMNTISLLVSENLKQCIVARWITLSNNVDINRQHIINEHVFHFIS